MKEVTRLPSLDMQTLILKLLRDTISDKDGNLPADYMHKFDKFETDEDGCPYIQSLSGLISMVPDKPNEVYYSANFGYTAEQVSIETRNLTKLVLASGWELIVGAGHFVTPDQQLLMGEEGYRAHQYFMEQHVIQSIRRAAESRREQQPKLTRPVEIVGSDGQAINANKDPKIILPN